MDTEPKYIVNDTTFTKQQFFDILTQLAQAAIEAAPTAGDHTATGLTYHFCDNHNWL